MVKLITGRKGAGKTGRLIEMANNSVKTTDGHIVFIDDDKRHIYDLHYDIRFVETRDYPLANYKEFIGFICGILSQDADIREIYIDGLHNVIETIDNEQVAKLVERLNEMSNKAEADFIISHNCIPDELPESLKQYVI